MPSGFFIHNEAHRYTRESVNGFINTTFIFNNKFNNLYSAIDLPYY